MTSGLCPYSTFSEAGCCEETRIDSGGRFEPTTTNSEGIAAFVPFLSQPLAEQSRRMALHHIASRLPSSSRL